MDTNGQQLFVLIKQSQFSEIDVFCLPELSSEEWKSICDEAIAQSVLGLILPRVAESYLSENPKMREAMYMHVANYARYVHAQDNLCSVMNVADIPFVILKGNAAAIYYKTPSERTMGDIDFQVLPEDFEKTRKLLIDNGYALDISSEEHDRHIAFSKDGVQFELHRKFSYASSLLWLVL